jgi:hypothetical protein
MNTGPAYAGYYYESITCETPAPTTATTTTKKMSNKKKGQLRYARGHGKQAAKEVTGVDVKVNVH